MYMYVHACACMYMYMHVCISTHVRRDVFYFRSGKFLKRFVDHSKNTFFIWKIQLV